MCPVLDCVSASELENYYRGDRLNGPIEPTRFIAPGRLASTQQEIEVVRTRLLVEEIEGTLIQEEPNLHARFQL